MQRVVVWLFRVVWVAQVLVVGTAVGDALESRARAVQLVGTIGCWVVWAVVLVASLVPTTVSLTALRMAVPAAVVVAAVSWAAGASATWGALALGGSLVATLLVLSGEVGEVFAQGSAYGDERRMPLRAPGALLIALPLVWSVLTGAVLIGPLALAAQQWALGVPVTVLAVLLGTVLPRRFHRLSRRWLVIVPAGLVVHDHVVLAETAMVARANLAAVGLALVGTGAANLTGNAPGPVVEVRVRDLETVVLAAPPRGQTKALHVQAFLVSPTRPGRALRVLHEAGIPSF